MLDTAALGVFRTADVVCVVITLSYRVLSAQRNALVPTVLLLLVVSVIVGP